MTKLKLAFLDEILKDEKIRKKFNDFVAKQTKISDRVDYFLKDIYQTLNNIEVEFFLMEYDYDEEEVVNTILGVFETDISLKISNYDINSLINLLIALDKCEYDFIDTSGFFGDFKDYSNEWLKKQINKVIKKVDFSKFENIFELLVKYEVSGAFEKIYLQVLEIKKAKKVIDKLPNEVKFYVYLETDKQQAKKIALQLQKERYFDEFLSKYLDEELLNSLDAKKFYNLILKYSDNQLALMYKTLNSLNLEDYQKLNEEKKEVLKQELQKIFSSEYIRFLVKIYEFEKNYKAILEIANKQDYIFRDVVKPIKNIYPKEIFEILKIYSLNILNSSNKNRQLYKIIVRRLKFIADIEEIKNEVNQFIEYLYNHKPNLPALKDEMRKENLI